jgi:CMP/dCMP kinase
MIITISGNPGSGKSTVAKILVEKLNCELVNAGGIMRELAGERNMALEEFQKLAKKDISIDKEIDQRACDKAREYQKQGKQVVVEGRVQYHFLPESKKVYVYVEPKVGAERIFKDLQDKEAAAVRNQKIASSVEETMKLTEEREAGDANRYIKFYGTDHRKLENYDLIVNSSEITAKEVADKIVLSLEKIK